MSSDAAPPAPIVPRVRGTVLAGFCLAGLALSLAVHLLSYVGVAAQTVVPAVWVLHVAIFPPFLVLLLRMMRWRGPRDGPFSSRPFQWRALLPFFPRWVAPLVVVLFVYVFVNFFWAGAHLPGRGTAPTIGDGSAHEIAVYTMRAFSGHWLVFYLVCALFFLYVPSDADPRSARS